jgi:hypothetical protein
MQYKNLIEPDKGGSSFEFTQIPLDILNLIMYSIIKLNKPEIIYIFEITVMKSFLTGNTQRES